MLRPLQLLHRSSTLVCSHCQKFSSLKYVLGTMLPSNHYSTVEHSATKTLQVQASVPKHLGRQRPFSKFTDQIRPVSDMLLRSMAKRHEKSFAVPGTWLFLNTKEVIVQHYIQLCIYCNIYYRGYCQVRFFLNKIKLMFRCVLCKVNCIRLS